MASPNLRERAAYGGFVRDKSSIGDRAAPRIPRKGEPCSNHSNEGPRAESPERGIDRRARIDESVPMTTATERGFTMTDVFADRAARIAREHDAATARAASETTDLLDSMRLAGFTFASDDRATVAATLATVAPKGGADLA